MFKVLIVEDEARVRRSIVQKLDWKSLGFGEVYEASHGYEALDIARERQPHLILTDIIMPFMDGLQLAEQLREELPAIKIAFFTGHDEFQYAQQAVSLGVVDYILKPFGIASLTKKVEALRDRLEAELRARSDLSIPHLATDFNPEGGEEAARAQVEAFQAVLHGGNGAAAVNLLQAALPPGLEEAAFRRMFLALNKAMLKTLSDKGQSDHALWGDCIALSHRAGEENSRMLGQAIENVAAQVAELVNQNELAIEKLNEGSLVPRVIAYIGEHYEDAGLSLTSVAARFQLSPGYLSTLFKRVSGMNFSEYVTTVRIEKAAVLLERTGLKNYEIAYGVGFSNPHYFSISFKRQTGQTPTEYRKRHSEEAGTG